MINLDSEVKAYKLTGNLDQITKILSKLDKILTNKSTYIYNRYKKHIVNIYDIDDIKQELIIFVYKIIDKYEIGKPFMSYFLSCIWHYKPNFLKTVINGKTSIPIELKTTDSIFDNAGNLKAIPVNETNNKIINEVFVNKFYNKIINLLYYNTGIKQSEIAKRLKTSEANISRAMDEIRKKLINSRFIDELKAR